MTGSHPAVIGVDFSGLSGRPDTLIEKEKISLRKIYQQLMIAEALPRFHGTFITPLRQVVFIGKTLYLRLL